MQKYYAFDTNIGFVQWIGYAENERQATYDFQEAFDLCCAECCEDFKSFELINMSDLRGLHAIEAVKVDNQLVLCKYADPIEDQVIGIDTYDAKQVIRENPALIYVRHKP